MWQELADNFNNTEDSDIAISKANCSAEPELCKGEESQRNIDQIMCSIDSSLSEFLIVAV